MEKPNCDSSFISHLDPNTWSISTPMPNSVGVTTELGRADWIIECPILFCLSSDCRIDFARRSFTLFSIWSAVPRKAAWRHQDTVSWHQNWRPRHWRLILCGPVEIRTSFSLLMLSSVQITLLKDSSCIVKPKFAESNDSIPNQLCFHHRTFGEAAQHCRQPCVWSGNDKVSH